MYEELDNLNINSDSEFVETLNSYINFLSEYNQKVNLISKNEVPFIFKKHIYDSLSLNLFFEKEKTDKNKQIKIIDMGTGGGFPSVPLALYYKNFEITAVDSIKKKIDYINSVRETYKLNNLTPMCSRAENLSSEIKNSFDIALTRAVAELPVILEYCVPFVKKGGFFIAYKSLKAEEELLRSKNAMKTLNVDLADKIEYTLPLETKDKRVLLVFRKKENTPDTYPRKNISARKSRCKC